MVYLLATPSTPPHAVSVRRSCNTYVSASAYCSESPNRAPYETLQNIRSYHRQYQPPWKEDATTRSFDILTDVVVNKRFKVKGQPLMHQNIASACTLTFLMFINELTDKIASTMYHCTLSSTLLKTVTLYRKTSNTLNKLSQTWKITFNSRINTEILRITKR